MKKRWLWTLAVLWVGAAYAGGLCLPGRMNYVPHVQLASVTVLEPPGLVLELLANNWVQNATYLGQPIGTWSDSSGNNNHFYTQFAAINGDEGLRFTPTVYSSSWYAHAFTTSDNTTFAPATWTNFTVVTRMTPHCVNCNGLDPTNRLVSIFSSWTPSRTSFVYAYTNRVPGYWSDSLGYNASGGDYTAFGSLDTANLHKEVVWAARFDGSILSVFRDGDKHSVDMSSTIASWGVSPAICTLGHWSVGSSLQGTSWGSAGAVYVDYNDVAYKSLRVYNRALTDAEIVGYAW